MSAYSSKDAVGPLCTRASLATDLHNLGLRGDATILLHSSLSALGFVVGGAETVISAILDVIGDEGTLVVPTFTGDNSDPADWSNPPVPAEWYATIRETMPAFDPRKTRPQSVGVIADTLRT
jgi:aminoglycoside 3-N-acetyltransferase